MDVLSLIGLILAFVAIIGGNFLEGGHLGALLNGPAALIVLGGTLGASLLQSPMNAFMRAMKIIHWIIFPPRIDLPGGVDRVIGWSMTARKEGLLGLETVADSEPDGYSRKGLQLLVDGAEPAAIRSILEVDFITQETRDIQAAKVFESMGGYAPTVGIIGAVMGLIHVMGNLADPSQLGSGIAVAFVATIYGVAMANLILLPVANKLKAIAHRQARYREMLLEGLLSIAEGENPRSIELKLQGFME
ncbi:flagellar motor protein [Pseudomonas syringae pv. aptata]|jgi:chemotaxis protein MotA|uniref:Flagellar motor protein n=10 Tax=Pseudomonas syringae group TaxID=136849 RepID=F3FKY6_PSESX|nr:MULTISPECIES: flagellar motor protein [Pseudomonas]EGH30872.1 flagellar motor protein [Pseudomonas syringae pv. japonica str. M301072]KEZ66405.1 flagellar motor protein [Pseudomonas syringae pv. syringae FF5]AKF50668.1 Flagellar motor component [Pseudomonas syringae pv. syringae HS191]AVX22212.1 flagellar motor protein [Pseudomonas syringae pv. atrofaciens]AZG87391.1 flagellar motor protein [Pseudomonas syringae pv. pisi str. PP1]